MKGQAGAGRGEQGVCQHRSSQVGGTARWADATRLLLAAIWLAGRKPPCHACRDHAAAGAHLGPPRVLLPAKLYAGDLAAAAKQLLQRALVHTVSQVLHKRRVGVGAALLPPLRTRPPLLLLLLVLRGPAVLALLFLLTLLLLLLGACCVGCRCRVTSQTCLLLRGRCTLLRLLLSRGGRCRLSGVPAIRQARGRCRRGRLCLCLFRLLCRRREHVPGSRRLRLALLRLLRLALAVVGVCLLPHRPHLLPVQLGRLVRRRARRGVLLRVGGRGGCRLQLQQDGLHLEAGRQVVLGAAGRGRQGQSAGQGEFSKWRPS